jgi:hypothetical protein
MKDNLIPGSTLTDLFNNRYLLVEQSYLSYNRFIDVGYNLLSLSDFSLKFLKALSIDDIAKAINKGEYSISMSFKANQD